MRQQPANCPDPARLRGLLDGTLPGADRGAVGAHIKACAACQEQLALWTKGQAVVAAAPVVDDESYPAARPTRSDMMPGIEGERAPGSAAGQRTDADEAGHLETADIPPGLSENTTASQDEPAAGAHTLNFLAPSDQPKSLGRLGPYEVLGRIGQGGMGIVLKAHEERLNRIVAVKVLMPALAASTVARRRFLREAQAAAAVCHEHVVTIHAVDEAAGLPYLVMQLVAGVSLQQTINRDGPLGLKEILRIGMQIASGLAAAHAQGLVHRDIKPANILLENGVARVKITDFGLARAVDDASLSASGTITGTPHYMSPEQARGEPIDRRSDLFSLGSVLYAMCTGEPPFRAETTVAVLRKVSDERPRSIHVLNPDVPGWVEAIIAKLMAKDPGRRYQTAGEVADVLERHLAELQAPGQATTIVTTAPAAPRRRAMRATEVVALLFSLSALAVGLLTLWVIRSRDSAHDAAEPVVGAPPTAPSSPRRFPAGAGAPAAPTVPTDAVMAEALCSRAADAIKRNELSRAVELYTEAIRRDPASTSALLGRAGVLNREEITNWAGTIADTTEVIRLDPKNAEAYELRAAAEQRSGAHRRAIDDATEALKLEPARVWAYLHRGGAYNGLSEWDRAIGDFDELIRRAPTSPWARVGRAIAYAGIGSNDRALGEIDSAIKLAPRNSYIWSLRARFHGQMDDYEQALADCAEAIRVTPEADKAWAYRDRANFERGLSKIEPAIADCNEAIRLRAGRLDLGDAGLFGSRASLYLAHDETDRALADFDAAIRIAPRSAWDHFYRGFAWARKGRWDRAMNDFVEAASLFADDKPMVSGSLECRAACLGMVGRIEEAETAYRESVRLLPSRVSSNLVIRAWFVDRPRGDYDAALKKLDEVAKTGSIYQFLDRGLIYVRLGKPDQALADFAEVLKRVKPRPDWFAIPDFKSRWLALVVGRGGAYLLKNDLEHALADADEGVRFSPQSAEARLLRAAVHARRGKEELAAADRREAARLAPDPILAMPEPRPPAYAKGH